MISPRFFRRGISELIVTGILLCLALAVIFPLVLPWLFVFKTQLEYAYNPWSLPQSFQLENFTQAWDTIHIGQGFINTLIVCLGAIICTVPPAAMAGYIFAHFKSKTTEVIFYAVLAGFFVPVQMVLVPLYKINMKFIDSRLVYNTILPVVSLFGTGAVDAFNSISNTLHATLVPLMGVFLPMAAFGIPFWVMIYRSFFRSLPGDLVDAARIDGASETRTFFSVMLPLAAPATVLAAILVFIGAWSDYLLSLVLLNDQNNFTMQLRVASFLNAYGTDRMPKYAAATILSSAPTLLLYMVGHRWIMRGTLAGALKE